MKLEEFAAAASSFESALETAKLQGDEDAEVAICKALDDVKSKWVKQVLSNFKFDVLVGNSYLFIWVSWELLCINMEYSPWYWENKY